jgi:hypothetical protein
MGVVDEDGKCVGGVYLLGFGPTVLESNSPIATENHGAGASLPHTVWPPMDLYPIASAVTGSNIPSDAVH